MLTGRTPTGHGLGIAEARLEASPGSIGLDGAQNARGTYHRGACHRKPAYRSPEQAAGDPRMCGSPDRHLRRRGDGYECSPEGRHLRRRDRRRPIGGTSRKRLHHWIPRGLTESPGTLAAAVMRCLEKDRGNRWPSAESLLDVIEPFRPPRRAARRRQGVPVSRAAKIGVVPRHVAVLGDCRGRLGARARPSADARTARWRVRRRLPQLLASSRTAAPYDAAFLLARRAGSGDPRRHRAVLRVRATRFALPDQPQDDSLRAATVKTSPTARRIRAWNAGSGGTPLGTACSPPGHAGLH